MTLIRVVGRYLRRPYIRDPIVPDEEESAPLAILRTSPTRPSAEIWPLRRPAASLDSRWVLSPWQGEIGLLCCYNTEMSCRVNSSPSLSMSGMCPTTRSGSR